MGNLEDLPPFLKLARNSAKHSTFKIKVGAVLAMSGRALSVGFNKIKYCSRYSHLQEQSLHAEMSCLKTCGRDYVDKATIFVYRETKNGKPAMSRPCEKCKNVLKSVGVKRMVYSIPEYPYFEVEEL
jgi:deoxycytidylate deaminase